MTEMARMFGRQGRNMTPEERSARAKKASLAAEVRTAKRLARKGLRRADGCQAETVRPCDIGMLKSCYVDSK